jgi:gluconolactonase
MPSTNAIIAASALFGRALAQNVPAAAQVVDQKIFNVLASVPPPAVANDSTVYLPHPCLIQRCES